MINKEQFEVDLLQMTHGEAGLLVNDFSVIKTPGKRI